MDYSFEITRLVKNLKDGDTITLENKEYHIYPDFLQERVICVSNNDMDGFKKTAFLIENKKNITVDGNGAKLIFHGIVNPFFITNYTLRIMNFRFQISKFYCFQTFYFVTACNPHSFLLLSSHHHLPALKSSPAATARVQG